MKLSLDENLVGPWLPPDTLSWLCYSVPVHWCSFVTLWCRWKMLQQSGLHHYANASHTITQNTLSMTFFEQSLNYCLHTIYSVKLYPATSSNDSSCFILKTNVKLFTEAHNHFKPSLLRRGKYSHFKQLTNSNITVPLTFRCANKKFKNVYNKLMLQEKWIPHSWASCHNKKNFTTIPHSTKLLGLNLFQCLQSTPVQRI